MKTLLISAFILMISSLCAQDYSVKIVEEYSSSTSDLFNKADEFQNNSIENGMYVSKAANMHAQIDFPYSLYDRQHSCTSTSDMEYTIVKVKGDSESFICVQVDPEGDKTYPYLVFQYNELGDWNLTNYLQDKTYASGKAKVNPGTTANTIKIQHRYRTVEYYMNGELATAFKADNSLNIRWYNNKIYSKNKKLVLGLDKLMLGGCVSETAPPVKVAEPDVVQPAALIPGEIIDYNKIYDPQPDSGFIPFRDKFEKWGVKNLQGEILFAPKLTSQPEFYNGVAFVFNGRAALVDTTGKELTPYQYWKVNNFSEGVALVSICDDNGENCKYRYIDHSGKEVLALPEKYVSGGSFFDGLAVVSRIVKGTGQSASDYKYGYIDRSGNEVIPAIFDEAGDFRYHRAPVVVDHKVGYINLSGTIIIPPGYYKTGDISKYVFVEGLASVPVKTGSEGYQSILKYGFIDVNGEEVTPLKYSYDTDFIGGVAIVSENGKYGFIDKTGKEITPLKYYNYNEYKSQFVGGFALVVKNDPDNKYRYKSGFIDKTGYEAIPLIYADAIPFSEGLAGVKICAGVGPDEFCRWGFIDTSGKMVISPVFSYIDEGWGFSEGLLCVSECKDVDGETDCIYGFADKSGKLVIPLKYDYAESFFGGLAKVELNGLEFYIDKTGKELR